MTRFGAVRTLFLAVLTAVAAPRAAAAEDGETILGVGSYWRAYAVWRSAAVPLHLLREAVPGASAPEDLGFPIETTPPPAGWTAPDFDDTGWYRSPGPIRPRGPQGPASDAAVMCLRGKFTVIDPTGVKSLTLSLAYRGGVVVYLNGREVGRGHMPAGEIGLETSAAPYSRATYSGSQSRPGRESAAQAADRSRRLGPVSLPVAALRKGLNVLALSVHRSEFRPEAVKWPRRYGVPQGWSHIGLSRLSLVAGGAGGIAPNTSRPRTADGTPALRVWNQDLHRIASVAEYGDPHEALLPIRLLGARNGYYSGQVVVESPSAIRNLEVVAGDLTHVDGTAKIAASNVRVRYLRTSTIGISAARSGLGYPRYVPIPAFVALEDEAPAIIKPATLNTDRKTRSALGLPPRLTPGAVQPIWITLLVPKDATAGRYSGHLTISATGVSPIQVAIDLQVIDWALPNTRDFRTFIGVYQSPESVALQYGVPLWSEKHWTYMERSFELLGYLGNRLVLVPLVNRTQLGNDEGMVPWVRQRDGTYTYDLTAYERYLALAAKHCEVSVITHHVYLARGWRPPGPQKPTFVTVVDAATGTRRAMQLPTYGTEKAKALWRPVIAALRRNLKKQGLHGARLVMGIAQDGGVHKDVVAHFKAVFPEATWHYGAHNRPRTVRGRSLYGYSEYLYVPHLIAPPSVRRKYGWASTPLTVMSQRLYDNRQPPLALRTMPERALVLGDNGAGRMCLDYWPVKGSVRHGGKLSLFDRWPDSSSDQRCPHLHYLSFPGKAGAISTIKLEALREGLQEAEARIFVEQALVKKRITGDLAERAQVLLDRRTNFCRIVHSNIPPIRVTFDGGWQRRSADLYRLAAEVAGAVNPKD